MKASWAPISISKQKLNRTILYFKRYMDSNELGVRSCWNLTFGPSCCVLFHISARCAKNSKVWWSAAFSHDNLNTEDLSYFWWNSLDEFTDTPVLMHRSAAGGPPSQNMKTSGPQKVDWNEWRSILLLFVSSHLLHCQSTPWPALGGSNNLPAEGQIFLDCLGGLY